MVITKTGGFNPRYITKKAKNTLIIVRRWINNLRTAAEIKKLIKTLEELAADQENKLNEHRVQSFARMIVDDEEIINITSDNLENEQRELLDVKDEE